MFANTNTLWKIILFIPVLLVYGIIVTVFYAFFVYYVNDNQEFTILKTFNSIVFMICAVMTMVCHTKSMITHPGKVDPQKLRDESKIIEAQDRKEVYCKKCNKGRPVRSHHCSTCKQCILKMDHHCPWIFNCVGLYNQKSFYLFLFYSTIGDLVACICLVNKIFYDPEFFKMLMYPKKRIDFNSDSFIYELLHSLKDPIIIIMAAVLSFAMSLAIGILFFYQTYLMAYNCTSIESTIYSDKTSSPYYQKNKIFSLKSILGMKFTIRWFWPNFEENIYNSGYNYHMANKKEQNFNNDQQAKIE
jgi:hypothetical protein